MRKTLFISFLLVTFLSFSQKKVTKKFELQTQEIIINTDGLDNLILENSDKNIIEVELLAESYDDQLIKVDVKNLETIINFEFQGEETREVIFRKFITKRLQRAEAIIKIPRNKKVSIFGKNVDVTSKSCTNQLSILLDNGIVKLNKIQTDVLLKLYAGNVYGTYKNSNINVSSSLGKIVINKKLHKESFQETSKYSNSKITIESIKANIFLYNN